MCMKRLEVIKLLAGLTAALALPAATSAESWDMTSPQPSDSYITKNVQWFADQVEKATDGKIHINVHPSGTLFPGKQTLRAVQRNQAQLGVRVLSAYQNQTPVFGIDSVPYLATSFAQSHRLWKLSKPVFEKKLSQQNVKLLYSIPWPPQGIFFDRKITDPSQMKGLKFRAYNNSTAQFARLSGMTPTLIEEAELSQAAATGMIQSLISSGEPVYNHQLWSYLPYFYDIKAWLVRSHVIMNKSRWNSLDSSTQKKVLKIAHEAAQRGEKSAKSLTDTLKHQLANKGVEINKPDAKLQAKFKQVGAQMRKDWLKNASPDARKIVKEFRAQEKSRGND